MENKKTPPRDSKPPPREATTFFKILNFELFVKPRWSVGILGTLVALGVGGWVYYNQLQWKKEQDALPPEERFKDTPKETEEELEKRLAANPKIQQFREQYKQYEEQRFKFDKEHEEKMKQLEEKVAKQKQQQQK